MKRNVCLNIITFVLFIFTVLTAVNSHAKTVTGSSVTVKSNYKSNSIWWNDLVIEITNNSSASINGWEIEFDFPYTINNFNNANLNSNNSGHYTVSNVGWGNGQSIEPGETISFSGGFSLNGASASSSNLPSSYIFNGTPIGGNTPPTIAFLSPVNGELINQNALYPIGISVSANDADGTVKIVKIKVDGKTFKGTNANWTPSKFGTFKIKGIVRDDKGAITRKIINVTVSKKDIPNIPPTVKITSPTNGAVIDQTNLSPISITIDPKDSDGTIASSSITVDGKSYNGTSASFTPSKFGTFTISANATDNKGASASDSIQITVKQKETPNILPTVKVTNPADGAVIEQKTLSPISITIDPKDSDGTIISSSITVDGKTYNGNSASFIPSKFGTFTITANATDNKGATASDSIQITVAVETISTFTIASSVVNAGGESYPAYIPPTGGHDTYMKGDKVTFNGNGYESLIDYNSWSPSAYPAGWKNIPNGGGTAGGTITPEGNITVNKGASQTFTMTPDSGYRVKDIKVDGVSVGNNTTYVFNNVSGNHAISAEFEEGEPNNSPVAEDDSANVTAGETITIDVLSNDTDEDSDELSITGVTAPALGTAEIKDGAILYTANSDTEGTDTFNYTISDGNGGEADANVSVNITKPGANKAPVVAITNPQNNQIIEQDALSPVIISIAATDEDGTVDATQIEVDGQKFENQNSVSWIPTKFGNHSIVVKAIDNDGAAGFAAATVIIKQKEDPDPEPTKKQIIGYINQWDGWKADERGVPKQGALNHTNIDWKKYTMVNFAFFGVAKDGSLHSGDYRNKMIYKPEESQEPADLIYDDKYSSFDPYFLKNTDGAKSIFDLARENNVKLMASIGGWSMCKHFPTTASDPVKKAKFIEDCKELINMGFDGIDLDWEYPGHKGMNIEDASEADYHNYTVMLKDIRDAIGSDKLLTTAINCMPSKIAKLEWTEIDKYLDYYNMMTYDIDGGWSEKAGHNSPLYDWKDASNTDNNISWNQTFKYLTETKGIKASKINMGMAFYGRSVETKTSGALGAETHKTLKTFDVDGPLEMAHDFVNFKDWEGTPYHFYIVNNTSDWAEHWDDVAKVPYKTKGNFFLSYDNEQSIAAKANYIVDNKAGGVIIWNAFADLNMSNASQIAEYGKIQTYDNISHPLIDKVYEIFKNSGGNEAPTVTITKPSNNQIITGDVPPQVTIEGEAYDADGTVQNLVVTAGGKDYSVNLVNGKLTHSWTPVAFGTYEIKAKATDNDGAVATAVITVIIRDKDTPEPSKKQIIGYINQWDGWKAEERGVPAKGALNQTNIDWNKYTMVNFAFFGVAKDGSLHSGDYRNKQIHQDGTVQEPAPMIHTDKYSSFDPYFLIGETEEIWWVGADKEDLLRDLGIEWNNDTQTWKNTKTGESGSYPIIVPKEGGQPTIFQLAREKGVKLLAAIGGWSMCKHFPEMASDATKKAKFIEDCKKLINMGFDGIDLDWEYPGHRGMNIESASDADYHNYTLLLQDLRAAIGSDKLLTSAINCMPSKIEKLEWSEIDKYLDYYNMMTYDIDGGWSENAGHNSPLYDWKDASNTDNNVSWDMTFKYLTQTKGIDPAKINMGMAFYGRSVQTKTAGALGAETKKSWQNFYVDGSLYMAHDFVNFKEWEGTPYHFYIINNTSAWTEHWDDKAKVPYKTMGNFFLSYDNERSIEYKAKYVVENKGGGVIVWNAFADLDMSNASVKVDHDKIPTFTNITQPLIDTLHNVFETYIPEPENIPPTVSVTSHSDSQIIEVPELGEITIVIDASDSDGTIVASSIAVDGNTYSGTTASWTPSRFGLFNIQVSATDNRGDTATESIVVTIKNSNPDPDNKPPEVAFVSPENGDIIETPTLNAVDIIITVSDSDGTVVASSITVEGNTYSGTSVSWIPSTFGIHSILASATDNDGDSATTNISVTIQQKQQIGSIPTINIMSPNDNQKIKMSTLSAVQINIDANDADGDIDEVVIKVDGQTFADINAKWTPTTFGEHNIKATVTDMNGNTATASSTITIVAKGANEGQSVRGWPEYIAMGAVTLTSKGAHTGRPVDAVFKYAGDGGNGDRGFIKYPIFTKNCAIMCEELEQEFGMKVMPVMVIYTCEMSGGTNFEDLHVYDNLVKHFVNLIHTTQILQSFKSESNPYPGAYVMNPDMMGMVQQMNLLPQINAEPILVQKAMYKALHVVYDKYDYKGQQLNPMEIFTEMRKGKWSDWDVKYDWEQLVEGTIVPAGSEEVIKGVPQFEDNIKGWIQANHYIIKRFGPNITFGWQENIWSNGGSAWCGSSTDAQVRDNIAAPTVELWNQVEIYTGTYKPDFLVFDKYERDITAGGFQFNDHGWDNYMSYAIYVSQGLGNLPVMLWQIPGAHIAIVNDVDTRDALSTAPNYFFGDPLLKADLSNIKPALAGYKTMLLENGYNWSSSYQLPKAKECNVFSILWGGGGTTSVGTFPYDDGGWLSNTINKYYKNPVYLTK